MVEKLTLIFKLPYQTQKKHLHVVFGCRSNDSDLAEKVDFLPNFSCMEQRRTASVFGFLDTILILFKGIKTKDCRILDVTMVGNFKERFISDPQARSALELVDLIK